MDIDKVYRVMMNLTIEFDVKALNIVMARERASEANYMPNIDAIIYDDYEVVSIKEK